MEEKKDGGFSALAVGGAAVVRISTLSAQAALCAAAGVWVDRRFGTAPWGLLLGAASAGAAFVVGLVATVKRLEAENAEENATADERAATERQVDKAAVDAAISAESLKTAAFREEFERFFERASSDVPTKRVSPEKSERSTSSADAGKSAPTE